MKKCRITVMKVARYDDHIEKYENPIEHTSKADGINFISEQSMLGPAIMGKAAGDRVCFLDNENRMSRYLICAVRNDE